MVKMNGGKGDDPDAGWRRLVALHSDVNGNNNNNV